LAHIREKYIKIAVMAPVIRSENRTCLTNLSCLPTFAWRVQKNVKTNATIPSAPHQERVGTALYTTIGETKSIIT